MTRSCRCSGRSRDERAAPLFIYILDHTEHRGALETVYVSAIEALGKAGRRRRIGRRAEAGALSRRMVGAVPDRAPARRRGAALRDCGSPAAQQALEEAAADGPRGVRRAAKAALAAPATRGRHGKDQLMDAGRLRIRRRSACGGSRPPCAARSCTRRAIRSSASRSMRSSEAVVAAARRPAVGGDRPHRPGDRRRRHAAAARPRKTTAS